jgi:hypothetical protein
VVVQEEDDNVGRASSRLLVIHSPARLISARDCRKQQDGRRDKS